MPYNCLKKERRAVMENKDNEYLREKLLKMGENTTLREIQEYIDEMVNIRGWQNETPQDAMLLLTEEIGELAKEVRKSCTYIQNDVNKNRADDLNGEAADVFLMVLALCRTLDIDLLQAFKEKELINCNRKWG